MKTAVDRTPRKDRGRVINARFAAMAAHYLFEPDFCNVASGWEKGRVEKSVQDARRLIWQDAEHERFESFAALNAWLATRCLAAWDAPHPELAGVTIREAWTQERPHLMPMPMPFNGYVEVPARVSSTSLVSVARNRYSVPCAWAGHRVSVCACIPSASSSWPIMTSSPSIRAPWIAIRSATTGSITCRSSSASPVRCATAHRLRSCPTRCSDSGTPCSDTTAVTRSWRGC